MTTSNVNIGALPNDGTGDPLRSAFDLINTNFANVANANVEIANINIGTLPNDGTGDPLREAFEKINTNFSNLVAANIIGNSTVELLDLESLPNNSNVQNILNINQINIYNNNYPLVSDPVVSDPVVIPTPRAINLTTVYVPTVATPIGPYGNQEYIQIGTTPNDGTGDPLRVAFGKINNNFSNLFFTTTTTTTSYTVGLDDQIIFETDVNEFTQGEFQIRSSDSEGPNSQSILISAQLKNSGLGVRWVGYGTTFEGDALTRYDMDVIGGNIVIYAKPIANTVITHFIASSITWQGSSLPGLDLQLDGYSNAVMATQNDLNIATEN